MRKISPSGEVTVLCVSEQLSTTEIVYNEKQKLLYINNDSNSYIQCISLDGKLKFFVLCEGYPFSLAFDKFDNLYITIPSKRIRLFYNLLQCSGEANSSPNKDSTWKYCFQ